MRALTSFVGREEDIGTLLRRWDRVRAGEGQFVQIVGEPGLALSHCGTKIVMRLPFRKFQAAATASRQVVIAAVRSTRCD
jgi:hypothetical protein